MLSFPAAERLRRRNRRAMEALSVDAYAHYGAGWSLFRQLAWCAQTGLAAPKFEAMPASRSIDAITIATRPGPTTWSRRKTPGAGPAD